MRIWAIGFGASLLLAGAAYAQPQPGDPTGPQPKLPTEELSIISDNGKAYKFTVELPVTQVQQDTGEMFRKFIPADAGMLFMFPPPEGEHDMWMKNCPVPEDMLFIAADGTVKAIAENTVPYSERPIISGSVLATLELQGGITAKDGISVGDKVIAKQFPGG
jgi:uncharacterized membrane protein (UPF0127 family)